MSGLQKIGAGPNTAAFPAVPVALPTGGVFNVPSGNYLVVPGAFTFLQWFDAITQTWRTMTTPTWSQSLAITSDGYNYRLANMTGTVVGAVVTNGGTGYTNGVYFPAGFPITGNPAAAQQAGLATAPSVTIAAGGGTIVPQANLVVGGAINTTIAITAGGSGYTKAPILQISPPPPGGVPATATCTISAGAINAVTVTNQGAGYPVAPTVTVTRQQGDTTGVGGVLTVNATLALTGQVVAITAVNNGAALTSVPAITFAPASTTAATAIMCWTATTVTWTGATNAGNGNFGWINSAVTAGASTSTNPAITTGQFIPRPGFTTLVTTASPTTTTISDGGLHQIVPNAVLIMNSNGTISGATTTTIAQGGVSDLSYLLPL